MAKAETTGKVNQRSDQWLEGGVTTIVVSGLLTISWRAYTAGKKIPFWSAWPGILGVAVVAAGLIFVMVGVALRDDGGRPGDAPPDIDPERFTAWFTAQWAGRAPSTWNVSLDAIRSAAAWWTQQGWITQDPSRMLKRRQPRPDRTRALSRTQVEQLLTRQDISLRERTFWRMAYETAARSAEMLALNVEDLDLPNRRAKVCRKGGAVDWIIWQTGTARLLPRLLKGRKSGPVFVTERKARVQLPTADLDEHGHARLSYQQAAALFSEASGGATTSSASRPAAAAPCSSREPGTARPCQNR